jgi:hypothetical protein
LASVGSTDPMAQIAFIASLGFTRFPCRLCCFILLLLSTHTLLDVEQNTLA